jgi:polysaccharide deacetylase family protein (PEP-CTERM system associated)
VRSLHGIRRVAESRGFIGLLDTETAGLITHLSGVLQPFEKKIIACSYAAKTPVSHRGRAPTVSLHRALARSCGKRVRYSSLACLNEDRSMDRKRNAFSIDVEDYFQVAALSGAISRESWPTREYRVESNTQRILSLLDSRGVRGTFFVLGWVAERSPGLVRTIAEAGHEVACHGFSHQLIYRQSPDEFLQETTRAKHHLEDVIGQPVLGYRAASFSITRQSLWALDVLLDLGFVYDSSIFPIRHDLYGIPGASRAPGHVTAPSQRTLVEFPMSAAQFCGLQIPVSGGGYFRILPYWLTRAGLRQINEREGHPFTFYLHPWEVDPGQPRVKVGMLSRFRHYTNLHRCEGRLARVLGDFAFAPMREVLRDQGLLQGPAFSHLSAAVA